MKRAVRKHREGRSCVRQLSSPSMQNCNETQPHLIRRKGLSSLTHPTYLNDKSDNTREAMQERSHILREGGRCISVARFPNNCRPVSRIKLVIFRLIHMGKIHTILKDIIPKCQVDADGVRHRDRENVQECRKIHRWVFLWFKHGIHDLPAPVSRHFHSLRKFTFNLSLRQQCLALETTSIVKPLRMSKRQRFDRPTTTQ